MTDKMKNILESEHGKYLSLLARLCDADGPSGFEDKIKDIIIEEASPYADKLYIDRMGSVIVFKKGKIHPTRPIQFDAHMDEVGFIITAVTDEGYIKFESIGGVDAKVLPAKRVRIGDSSIPGVISSTPVHMQKGNAAGAPLSIKDMVIDFGAESKEDALKYVAVGDHICFDSDSFLFGDNDSFFKGKALDDRLGCFLMLNALKEDLPYDTYFSFSVQEETGLRGAKTAAHQIKPYIGVAIDSTTAGDVDGVSGMNVVCRQGEGGVISLADGATVYEPEIVQKVMDAAKEKNIKAQYKLRATGGNNAAALQRMASGARVIALSAPSRYIHSPSSTIKVSDIIEMQKLITLLIDILGEESYKKCN